MTRRRMLPRYREAVQKGVRGISPRLRAALREEAEARGLSMNDLCITVLADAFNLHLEDAKPVSGGPNQDLTDRDDMTIRMPVELRNAIRHRAIDEGISDQALIVDLLASGIRATA